MSLAASLSPDHLMSAPLPDLLVELDAELYDSSITDRTFFGCAIQRRDGHVALAMPPGRDEVERDTIARMLLGKLLGIQMAPLPRGLSAAVTAG
ncbi:hypothetical protein [Streptomyces sp. NPDC059994]|uniref:hypothetical protein n=1 Tax=Streptomyces sp. NPDC059994 TaxID=3347029 RepID=UPI0036BEAAEB